MIKTPWKGHIGHDLSLNNVREQFYYWNHNLAAQVGHEIVTQINNESNNIVKWNFDSNSKIEEMEAWGDAIAYFGDKAKFKKYTLQILLVILWKIQKQN